MGSFEEMPERLKEHLRGATPEFKERFARFHYLVLGISNDVDEKVVGHYTVYSLARGMGRKSFVNIRTRGRVGTVSVFSEYFPYSDERGIVEFHPAWRKQSRYEFKFTADSDIEYCASLVRQAYEKTKGVVPPPPEPKPMPSDMSEREFELRVERPWWISRGLIKIPRQYRHLFPPRDKPVILVDDERREYSTHMHTLVNRIDGLRAFYRNHPEVRVGSIIWVLKQDDGRFELSLRRVVAVPDEPDHDEIRDEILDLGILEGYEVQKEFPVDHERLDAVWRRKIREKPDIVFEVQIAGNIYSALVKMKEAWDKWKCLSILVTTEEYIENAKRWLGRAFHEMEDDARVVLWTKMKELHQVAKRRRELKDEVGIHP